MFEFGTTEIWWKMAKKYPLLSDQKYVLKPLGSAFIIDMIETYKPKTILEVGHGGFSFIFELLYDTMEMWGLDDYLEGSSVEMEDLLKLRNECPKVKFVKGFLGDNINELPENYFDLVYSISVIEHVPHEKLGLFFEEAVRVTKPGGIIAHSYDVYFKQNTKFVFDAFENAGLEWLKPRESMNIFWEKWLCNLNDEELQELIGKIILENPMVVAEIYMWQQERSKRRTPLNFMSVLCAAKKL